MPADVFTNGVVAGRLEADAIAENFTDLHGAYDGHEAAVAADRCYFCYDAPCITACPTAIDIPLFIRQISTGTSEAAAKTIFEANILGGMTDKKVAVIGAGPAGLSCAHRLAMKGHAVDIYDAKPKGGGLNEYGIAAYKTVNDFAQAEVDWLLKIGGITVHYDAKLGGDLSLAVLQESHDAVFLGMGLGGVNALSVDGGDRDGVMNAVDFIAALRQSKDKTDVEVGRRVVVIGGGMTAVDAAVQAKLLGAEQVTMAYRRGKEAMSASIYEQELATAKGVRILYNAQPEAVSAAGVEFAYTETVDGQLRMTGETQVIEADMVLRAIGQTLSDAPEGLTLERGKIKVGSAGATSVPGVWAGGDCATGGDDLTVTAVAEGRDAAENMHKILMGDV
jgi:dihydropyrimidine dehydrogenase (NAD+) subunit PreT